MEEIEELAYTQYASEKQETEAAEYLYEIVRKLLDKLPDAERTVMTLYYLGEMTTKEISKFLHDISFLRRSLYFHNITEVAIGTSLVK